MNKKGKNPVITYYIFILLSVIDLVAGITFLVIALLNLISGITGGSDVSFSTFEGQTSVGISTTGILQYFPPWLCIILACICFALMPILTSKRQALRDEVEYDENGVNRKRGQFSQLSRKEREAIDQQKMMDAERILSATTFKSILHEGSEHSHIELDKMIGLTNVKKQISEMEARMAFEQHASVDHKKHKKKQTFTLSSMHMIFFGEPGTGKTTVARIMTGLLFEYGYIQKNQCVEIDGNFFNGLSVGESSKRASMLIQKSKGGVIFIDEAYALLSNGGGQEVIATIVKAMEDYKDELVFIFAGYEHEMKQLVNSNPGIESRVKYHLNFASYTLGELKQIFTYMAHEKQLLVSEELLNKFANEVMYLKSQPNFGNARTVRNLLDRTIDQHAINMKNNIVPEEDRYRLKSCDFPE